MERTTRWCLLVIVSLQFCALLAQSQGLTWLPFLGENSQGNGVAYFSGPTIGSGESAEESSNVFVAGWTFDGLGEYKPGSEDSDAFVSLVNTVKGVTWTRLLRTGAEDSANDIVVSDSQSLYVVGSTEGNLDGVHNSGLMDGFISRWNAKGDLQWVSLFGGSGEDEFVAVSVMADDSAVFAVGNTNSSNLAVSGRSDVVWVKYDGAGNPSAPVILPSTSQIEASDIAVAPSGYVYVVGQTNGNLPQGSANQGGWDGFLAAYYSNFSLAWVVTQATTGDDYTDSVAVGPDGTIYVCGGTMGNFTNYVNAGYLDYFIAAYNPDGTLAWLTQSGSSGDDEAVSITVDSQEQLFIGGTIGLSQSFIAKYYTNGTQNWYDAFGGMGYTTLQGVSGAIFFTGSSNNTDLGATGDSVMVGFYGTDGPQPPAVTVTNNDGKVAAAVVLSLIGALAIYSLAKKCLSEKRASI